jgi:hypothetical protein
MSKWLLRGLVFAAVVVVLRLIQGALVDAFPTQAGWISPALGLFLALPAIAWSYFDGRADANAQSDPDRREDLAMVWLVAGLIAGLLGDLVCWFIALFYPVLYTGGLISELTSFAAFTALLVFLVGVTAVTIGRWSVDRKAPPYVRRREGDEERADTDVFAAVQPGVNESAEQST